MSWTILKSQEIFLFPQTSGLVLVPTQPLPQGEMGGGTLSPKVKWLGSDTDLSPQSWADIKNAWSFTSTPQSMWGKKYNCHSLF
jgi:hypothetical protein